MYISLFQDSFMSSRTAAMFLAIAYDKSSEAWTGSSPNSLVSFFFNLTLSNNDVLNFLSFASQELLQADRTFFLLLFQQVFTSDTEMLMLIISAATFIYDYL